MNKRAVERIRFGHRRIEIDARAAEAYFACRAVRRVVPFERVSVAEQNAMLAVRKLVVLPVDE